MASSSTRWPPPWGCSASLPDARLRLAGDGSLGSVSPADRAGLATELDGVIAEHRRLWHERFRPGGLEDSVAWFDHLGACYRAAGPTGTGSGPRPEGPASPRSGADLGR